MVELIKVRETNPKKNVIFLNFIFTTACLLDSSKYLVLSLGGSQTLSYIRALCLVSVDGDFFVIYLFDALSLASQQTYVKQDQRIHMLAMPFSMISADCSWYGKKLRPRHLCLSIHLVRILVSKPQHSFSQLSFLQHACSHLCLNKS